MNTMKKIVYTAWINTAIGAILLALSTVYFFNEELTELFHILFLFIGYLPFIFIYRYFSTFMQKILFLLNTTLLVGVFFYFAPYIGHVIFYFTPIYAVLFKNRIYFVVSFIFSIAIYLVVMLIHPSLYFNLTVELVQFSVFLSYTIILYFVSSIMVRQEKLTSMYTKTMEALVLAIEAKDEYTRGHSTRVSEYSMIFGKTLKEKGFPIDLEILRISSLLHDIGKVNISNEILQKKGKLTVEEYNEIKKHPVFGSEIAKSLDFPDEIIHPILYHHERKDGRGYPNGLVGEEVPLLARIIAVADTFDALTTNRSYREAFTIEEARRIILENSGTQFDEEIIPYFNECFSKISYRAEQLIELEKQLSIVMDEDFKTAKK
ncbi:HD-GYP domain-containing protein [Bacillus sp. DJP31]|uniref:HD-GYP domain-containing protein n=1 Tax=Bacillus sp. DJP31 TaxID=3409789 RepID=UPI003BB7FD0D